MTFETVNVEEAGSGVTALTLSRPDRLNALNRTLTREIAEALSQIEADESCRVVILTGGGRGFCAGLDLDGYDDPADFDSLGTVRWMLRRQRELVTVVQRLLHLRQPVIAAINGPAAGGGLALALASDIRIASTSALFAVSFIRAGYSACDLGTSWLLPRIVGASRAHELMLTGRRFDASEAMRIGLVTEVVEPQALRTTALSKAAEIQLNPPISVEMTKQAMWLALQTPTLDAAIALEDRQQMITSLTDDQREATAAFLNRRAPVYRYR